MSRVGGSTQTTSAIAATLQDVRGGKWDAGVWNRTSICWFILPSVINSPGVGVRSKPGAQKPLLSLFQEQQGPSNLPKVCLEGLKLEGGVPPWHAGVQGRIYTLCRRPLQLVFNLLLLQTPIPCEHLDVPLDFEERYFPQ